MNMQTYIIITHNEYNKFIYIYIVRVFNISHLKCIFSF